MRIFQAAVRLCPKFPSYIQIRNLKFPTLKNIYIYIFALSKIWQFFTALKIMIMSWTAGGSAQNSIFYGSRGLFQFSLQLTIIYFKNYENILGGRDYAQISNLVYGRRLCPKNFFNLNLCNLGFSFKLAQAHQGLCPKF